ncbi:hypothetical protein PENTCL1PPCAC_27694 [Pristionchus entomophagus]|uniref:Uncharacterized protein n=1 Tax=Pristionchus entomophagus TaxID=358040 RepID=A0AAV5UHZ7_9BILA|nr:hypothetical protein PENTCL1PPCAC_27694 [Pristionchus entomophagus]
MIRSSCLQYSTLAAHHTHKYGGSEPTFEPFTKTTELYFGCSSLQSLQRYPSFSTASKIHRKIESSMNDVLTASS